MQTTPPQQSVHLASALHDIVLSLLARPQAQALVLACENVDRPSYNGGKGGSFASLLCVAHQLHALTPRGRHMLAHFDCVPKGYAHAVPTL